MAAFADGVPSGGHRLDAEMPNRSFADVSARMGDDVRPHTDRGAANFEDVAGYRGADVDADGAPRHGSSQFEATESGATGVVFDVTGRSVPLPRDVSVVNGEVVLVVDGQTAGRIPVDDYVSLRYESVHNPGADEVVLGKYAAQEGGAPYLVVAGERGATYFDMGERWGAVKKQYDLNDDAMFRYFNIPVLDEALRTGQRVFFSHDPNRHALSALGDERAYLQEHGYYKLKEVAGGWIAHR